MTKQEATNITAVATLDLPRSRGLKKSRSTQVRRGASNSNKKRRTTVDHYSDVTNDPPSQFPEPASNTTKNTSSTGKVKSLYLNVIFMVFIKNRNLKIQSVEASLVFVTMTTIDN